MSTWTATRGSRQEERWQNISRRYVSTTHTTHLLCVRGTVEVILLCSSRRMGRTKVVSQKVNGTTSNRVRWQYLPSTAGYKEHGPEPTIHPSQKLFFSFVAEECTSTIRGDKNSQIPFVKSLSSTFWPLSG